jgi:hypothetical protein
VIVQQLAALVADLPSPRDVGAGTFVGLIILALLTDKLVWGARLTKAEAQRDRWEQIALRALGVARDLTVQAEVTNEVLTRLPDPNADPDPERGGGGRGAD